MCLENGGKITKKLYFSLLSGALLFFVLSLFTNSYAREVSSNDIANSIYNIDKALNNVELTKNDINLTICELISNTFNNHQGYFCIFQRTNSTIEFSYFNGKVYMANNSPQCANGAYSIRYNLQTKQFMENSFIYATTESYGTYTYNDGIIYTANNSNNIYWNANTMRPRGFNMFEETLFIDDYFTFIYNINLNNITIEDFDVVKQVTSDYHGHNLADFGRTTHLKNVTLTYWKYEKERGYFEPFLTKSVNSYIIINEDLGELYFTYDMFVPNTIMDFGLTANDLENFESLSLFFYCVDSNTIINNGELDVDNTFNDDYYNRYNNILNRLISDDIGSITSPSGDTTGYIDFSPLTDDSQVDVILNDLPSTSGDMASEMGYSLLENPFTSFLYNIIEGITNTLLDHENVTLSFDFRGTTYTMNSDDIYMPNGLLKSLVTTSLVFLYIFISYKYYNHLIASLQKADISSLKKELGSDEFMDTNTM